MQAPGTGQRNNPAALVVVTVTFGRGDAVAVVMYSLVVMVAFIPMSLELGKRATNKAKKNTEKILPLLVIILLLYGLVMSIGVLF